MKKSILILLIFLVSIFVFFKATEIKSNGLYGLLISKEERYFYKKLAEFEKSDVELISLKDLTNFDWDQVKSYGTYNPSREKSSLKFYRNSNLVNEIHTYGFYLYNLSLNNDLVVFSRYGIEKESINQDVKVTIKKYTDQNNNIFLIQLQ